MLDRPSVIGFLAPRILIPAWLMGRLTPGELEQIVLHETEHLRRGDDWTNLLQKLLLVAFPLNPALAWMEHRLGREREMACDEGVVRITNAPRAYAACLASLAERGLERRAEALTLGAWQGRSELVYRVHGILTRKRELNKAAAGALLSVVGCALFVGSIELARCPQLVAFVPARKSMAMTPARQREMAAMLARESAEAKLRLPAGFSAVQAKAVLPEAGHAGEGKLPGHPCRKSTAAKAVKHDDAQLAKIEMAGDRVNADSEQQQWVVLSAWEEVRTVTRTSSTITDYYASTATSDASDGSAETQESSSKGTGHATNRLANQSSGKYTFTQLILRVAPTNSNFNPIQPAMSVRSGWFVIQL
jgi:hypothetical protein